MEILAEVLEEPILTNIRSSQAVGLEIDESTDVSVFRQLDLHIRYHNINHYPIHLSKRIVNSKYSFLQVLK